jgi:ribose transport system substrate-binding protein
MRQTFAAGAALAFALVGCGTSNKGPRQYTVGMSQCNLGEPWRVQMNADIKAAAEKHPNLKIVFKDASKPRRRSIRISRSFSKMRRTIR